MIVPGEVATGMGVVMNLENSGVNLNQVRHTYLISSGMGFPHSGEIFGAFCPIMRH